MKSPLGMVRKHIFFCTSASTTKRKRDIQQRNYLRKAKRLNMIEDWLIYKSHWDRVLKSIKTAKSRCNTKIIKESGDNPEALWKTIKKIVPDESKSVSSNFTIEGNMTTDNKAIAESFSKFFLETVGRLLIQ